MARLHGQLVHVGLYGFMTMNSFVMDGGNFTQCRFAPSPPFIWHHIYLIHLLNSWRTFMALLAYVSQFNMYESAI